MLDPTILKVLRYLVASKLKKAQLSILMMTRCSSDIRSIGDIKAVLEVVGDVP